MLAVVVGSARGWIIALFIAGASVMVGRGWSIRTISSEGLMAIATGLSLGGAMVCEGVIWLLRSTVDCCLVMMARGSYQTTKPKKKKKEKEKKMKRAEHYARETARGSPICYTREGRSAGTLPQTCLEWWHA